MTVCQKSPAKFERLVYSNPVAPSVNSAFMKKHRCGPRFRALLKEVNITPTEFAAFCKVEPQHVNNWYHRGVPDNRMEEIAALLSVNSKWLARGEGPKESLRLRPPVDEDGNLYDAQAVRGIYTVAEPTDIEIPFYRETPTAAGTGKTHVVQDPDQTLRLPRSHLDSLQIVYADAICATMIGNSMAERIEDGSILAIDRGLTQIVDGQIYALEHDGMLRIKYLHRLPGNGLRLRSHNNTQYPDEVFSAGQIDEQRISILGWVFWWSTLHKKRPPIPFLGMP